MRPKFILAIFVAGIIFILGCADAYVSRAKTVYVPDEAEVVGTMNGMKVYRLIDDKGTICYGMQYGSQSPAISCVKP